MDDGEHFNEGNGLDRDSHMLRVVDRNQPPQARTLARDLMNLNLIIIKVYQARLAAEVPLRKESNKMCMNEIR